MDTSDIHELLRLPDGMSSISELDGRARLARSIHEGTATDSITALRRDLLGLPGALDAEHEGEAGSYREVIVCADVVYKLPARDMHLAGVRCNVYEAAAYADDSHCGPVAPCQLLWHESGIPVLVMERVEILPMHLDRSEGQEASYPYAWGADADGWQVGWSDRSRSWVIYDAGCQPGKCAPPPVAWFNQLLTGDLVSS